MGFLDNLSEYRRLENKLIAIEKIDKCGLGLDEQCDLLDEYTKTWNKINELNKIR